MDPEMNVTGKWSCLLRARREIAENRAEIKRLRTLLRISGIAYAKVGNPVPLEEPSRTPGMDSESHHAGNAAHTTHAGTPGIDA